MGPVSEHSVAKLLTKDLGILFARHDLKVARDYLVTRATQVLDIVSRCIYAPTNLGSQQPSTKVAGKDSQWLFVCHLRYDRWNRILRMRAYSPSNIRGRVVVYRRK
jgi:hypothetical protein